MGLLSPHPGRFKGIILLDFLEDGQAVLLSDATVLSTGQLVAAAAPPASAGSLLSTIKFISGDEIPASTDVASITIGSATETKNIVHIEAAGEPINFADKDEVRNRLS